MIYRTQQFYSVAIYVYQLYFHLLSTLLRVVQSNIWLTIVFLSLSLSLSFSPSLSLSFSLSLTLPLSFVCVLCNCAFFS